MIECKVTFASYSIPPCYTIMPIHYILSLSYISFMFTYNASKLSRIISFVLYPYYKCSISRQPHLLYKTLLAGTDQRGGGGNSPPSIECYSSEF